MQLSSIRAATGAVLLAAGCGLGPLDDASGGKDHLPTRGAGPYAKTEIDFDTPADEPYILADTFAHVRDPAPLRRPDGGIRLWLTRQEVDREAAEIWYTELPSVHDLPDRAPAAVLTADAEWEVGVVAEPSLVDLGAGRLVLYYRGGAGDAPAIGRADSSDGGETFVKHPDNPILPGAAGPAAIAIGDRFVLYYTAPDQGGIFAADSEDGVRFEPRPAPVVVPRPALADAFDSLSVSEPFAVVSQTQGDNPVHVGLFFTGARPGAPDGAEPVRSIGYAASYGGDDFDRFFGAKPILAGAPPSEAGPAVLLEPDGGTLFIHEVVPGRDRLAAAVHP
jgi:hypothetical protein